MQHKKMFFQVIVCWFVCLLCFFEVNMNQRRKARNTENDLQYGEEGRMTGQFFSRSELKLDQNGPRARTHSGGGGEQTQTAARKSC